MFKSRIRTETLPSALHRSRLSTSPPIQCFIPPATYRQFIKKPGVSLKDQYNETPLLGELEKLINEYWGISQQSYALERELEDLEEEYSKERMEDILYRRHLRKEPRPEFVTPGRRGTIEDWTIISSYEEEIYEAARAEIGQIEHEEHIRAKDRLQNTRKAYETTLKERLRLLSDAEKKIFQWSSAQQIPASGNAEYLHAMLEILDRADVEYQIVVKKIREKKLRIYYHTHGSEYHIIDPTVDSGITDDTEDIEALWDKLNDRKTGLKIHNPVEEARHELDSVFFKPGGIYKAVEMSQRPKDRSPLASSNVQPHPQSMIGLANIWGETNPYEIDEYKTAEAKDLTFEDRIFGWIAKLFRSFQGREILRKTVGTDRQGNLVKQSFSVAKPGDYYQKITPILVSPFGTFSAAEAKKRKNEPGVGLEYEVFSFQIPGKTGEMTMLPLGNTDETFDTEEAGYKLYFPSEAYHETLYKNSSNFNHVALEFPANITHKHYLGVSAPPTEPGQTKNYTIHPPFIHFANALSSAGAAFSGEHMRCFQQVSNLQNSENPLRKKNRLPPRTALNLTPLLRELSKHGMFARGEAGQPEYEFDSVSRMFRRTNYVKQKKLEELSEEEREKVRRRQEIFFSYTDAEGSDVREKKASAPLSDNEGILHEERPKRKFKLEIPSISFWISKEPNEQAHESDAGSPVPPRRTARRRSSARVHINQPWKKKEASYKTKKEKALHRIRENKLDINSLSAVSQIPLPPSDYTSESENEQRIRLEERLKRRRLSSLKGLKEVPKFELTETVGFSRASTEKTMKRRIPPVASIRSKVLRKGYESESEKSDSSFSLFSSAWPASTSKAESSSQSTSPVRSISDAESPVPPWGSARRRSSARVHINRPPSDYTSESEDELKIRLEERLKRRRLSSLKGHKEKQKVELPKIVVSSPAGTEKIMKMRIFSADSISSKVPGKSHESESEKSDASVFLSSSAWPASTSEASASEAEPPSESLLTSYSSDVVHPVSIKELKKWLEADEKGGKKKKRRIPLFKRRKKKAPK
ncbi:MAG: hypothetical protein MI784_00120 [Cytophagales bacterium]|nr:hypothetical protein [Cytophagales bacterium]